MVPRRAVATVVAAAPLLAIAVGTGHAAAPGKVKVGVDRVQHVSFSVEGRAIVVMLRASGSDRNPLAAELSNQSVVVACKGRSPKRGAARLGELETSWPTGSDVLRGQLSRDVSGAMQWCVLEQPDGADIAVTRKLRAPQPTAAPTPTPTPGGVAGTSPVPTSPAGSAAAP
jgi:hypothetical protein